MCLRLGTSWWGRLETSSDFIVPKTTVFTYHLKLAESARWMEVDISVEMIGFIVMNFVSFWSFSRDGVNFRATQDRSEIY